MTTFSTSQLEDVLKNVDPMTEDEIARTMRLLSRRAWEATQELGQVVRELGEANANSEHQHDSAMLASQVEHPDWRVAHHTAHARLASEGARAEVFYLTHKERGLHKELEILHELLISCAVQWKHLVSDDLPAFGEGRAA